jgi:hypothetical protein
MILIIDVEDSQPGELVLEALQTMLRQVAEDNAADPDLEVSLELADPVGRALKVTNVRAWKAELAALVPYVSTEVTA